MCQTRETAREGARAAPLHYPVGAGVPVLARVRADGRRERGPRRRTRCSAGCCRWPGRWPSAPSRLVGRWIRGRGNGPLKAVWPGRLARSWSADGAGFEVFASITIAVELDRLSATASDRGPVTAVADRQDEPLTGHPRE